MIFLNACVLGAVLVGCTLDSSPVSESAPVDSLQGAAPLTVQDSAIIAPEAVPPTAVLIAQEVTIAPTLPPTPTVPPEQILLLANRQLLNGYYEDAVLSFQTLLRQPGSAPSDIAAALFGVGQAAIREGLFGVAADALNQLISQYPDDPRAAQAYFLRGEAHLGTSAWAEAITDFETYLARRPGMLDSYALERIGDAQIALNQLDAALATYQRAAGATRGLVPSLALRERVAQVLYNAGRTTEAVAQYDAILAVAENAPYRADIGMRAARALITAGDTASALPRMKLITETTPTAPQAYEAMQLLRQNAQPFDEFLRARISFAYGDYEGTVDALNRWSASRSSVGEIPAEFHLLLGRAYRELSNTEAAVTAFQTIINSYTTDPLFGSALLEQGRTRFLAGDSPGAIGQYVDTAERYNYLPEAPEALWRAGYLYSTNDQPAEARAIFERLADAFPNTQQAIDGLFLAGAAAYRTGDLTAAERYYAELGVKATGEDQADAYFWLGRLALQRGDQAAAGQAFGLAQGGAPDSYFAARARDIIAGRSPFTPPAQPRYSFDDAAEIAEAETWLRTTFPTITQTGSLWQLAPELASDPRLLRGVELWTVAAFDEAEAEFIDIINANTALPLASYQLAIYLRSIGAYYYSILASSYIIRAAQVGTLDAPGYIARMRYPVYYLDVVQAVAGRRGFDPLLLFSLIRHESLFDATATAAAGEIGLTQVIPGTAQYIAEQLGWRDYQHTDLFRPHASVEFGAFYLDEQLRRFDGNATAALAGYNAGPGRAIDWLAISGGDPDQFMSAITIPSTRLYVERIYSYYAIYRELYNGA